MENQLALFCKDAFQESNITSKTMLEVHMNSHSGWLINPQNRDLE